MAEEEWRGLVQRHSRGVQVISSERSLSGEILKFSLADATLWAVSSDAQVMRRDSSSLGGTQAPMAVLQLSGTANIIQSGKHCKLSSGTFTFIDAAAPHEVELMDNCRQLALRFPAATFRPAAYPSAIGKRMDATEPLNASFYQSVINIWRAAADIPPLSQSKALAALIAFSHMTTAISAAESEPSLPIRMLKAMDFIDRNLSDCNLNPQAVADAQGVSRRYLDALFAEHGHSLQSWMWERRLQKSADELRLSSARTNSILMTALNHGFKTPSHFSRAFAKRFGVPPKEYRQRNLNDNSSS